MLYHDRGSPGMTSNACAGTGAEITELPIGFRRPPKHGSMQRLEVMRKAFRHRAHLVVGGRACCISVCMSLIPRRIKHIVRGANFATGATTLATGVLGKMETGSAVAPLNATSHIVWGDEATKKDALDTRHTLVGAALNTGAMYGWSAVMEVALGKWVRRGKGASGTLARAAIAGTAVSALAYVTDYFIVPKRLTPGFENRLSGAAMATTYGAMAAGLAAGAVWGAVTDS